MGTSTSSSGSPGGASLDPPWLDDLAASLAARLQMQELGEPIRIEKLPPIGVSAPARRFFAAKVQLGDFARTGDRRALRRALGHYSRTGMGGAASVARRMRPSTVAGSGLAQLLEAARNRTDPRVVAWVDALVTRGSTADEIAAEIVRRVTTEGGTLEEESCRASMAEALAELLEQEPDVDLLAMDADDIWTVLEAFLSREAFNRILLDIGQLFEGVRVSPVEAVRRTNEMRDYIRSEVVSQMRRTRAATQNPTPAQIEAVLRETLARTFGVFEGFL